MMNFLKLVVGCSEYLQDKCGEIASLFTKFLIKPSLAYLRTYAVAGDDKNDPSEEGKR